MRRRNLRSSEGASKKEAEAARNAGVYRHSIPVLLEMLPNRCFCDDDNALLLLNLEYFRLFPLTSDQTVTARPAKPTTLIVLSNVDGGGGYIQLVAISILFFGL